MSKQFLSTVSVLSAAIIAAGCSTSRFKESADREVYRIIEEKSDAVPNMTENFSIEPPREIPFWEALPTLDAAEPFMGTSADQEAGSRILSLEQALAIAVLRNREYQSQREAVYAQALDLTLERHRFTPIFSGDVQADFNVDAVERLEPSDFTEGVASARLAIEQVEQLTGTPADLLVDFADIVEQSGVLAGLDQPELQIENVESVSGGTRIGVQRLLRGGGAVAVGITSNFLRILGSDGSVTSSVLDMAITQPLLAGAGRDIAAERLTQAERDVLYAIREFTQFRKDFSVDIASTYYSVLQDRDQVRNNWQSFQNFLRNAERERSFAAEGRRTVAELGRIESALLENENSWVNAIRRYRESLDRFKILLGISTDEKIVLDETELDDLRAQGLKHPRVSQEEAVQVALNSRLDLYNSRGRMEDAERQIRIAKNALLPRLDLVLAGDIATPEDGDFQALELERLDWRAGFDLELPLDRKSERNFYRTALIRRDQAERSFTLTEDNVKLAVRNAWRNLDQARRTYDIAVQSVRLNERRVEEQDLLAELGRATALDLVDAQNDLTDAQNALTAAVVAHTVARLEFWRDMGILFIKEDGQWTEINDYIADAETPEQG